MRTFECTHRGKVVRLVECPQCTEPVKGKVYSCAIHGECMMAVILTGGVKKCYRCSNITG